MIFYWRQPISISRRRVLYLIACIVNVLCLRSCLMFPYQRCYVEINRVPQRMFMEFNGAMGLWYVEY